MLTERYDHIGNDLALTDIAFNGFGLHVHAADKLHLRQHSRRFVLPVEYVNRFIIRRADGIVDQRFRLFSSAVQLVILLHLLFGSKDALSGMIFL